MLRNAFRRPAPPTRQLAATAAATALAAPAHAAEDDGKASAVVFRAGLDITLRDRAATEVPLTTSLGEVQAPSSAAKTALKAHLQGVDGGRPVTVLRADAATARATVDQDKAEGYTRLAKARVRLPGLPGVPLVEVEKVTARALCEAGERPVASSRLPGRVRVLGKKVDVEASGSTLRKPGNPLRTEAAPASTTHPRTGGPTPVTASVNACGAHVRPGSRSATPSLAETGAAPTTPYLAAGAAALLAGGGGALALTRTRETPTRPRPTN